MQPSGDKLREDRPEKSRKRTGLVGHEKGSALRRERIFSLSILFQKFESDERIHDRAKTARRRAGFLTHLFDGCRSGREGVENFIRDRCAADERVRVGKAKLLQPFGRDLCLPLSYL